MSERRTQTVVVPGNHDGVHRGHQALIARAKAMAARLNAETRAMFFDPHPTAVLAPERAVTPLTAPARRAALLKRAGADSVAVETFDAAFAGLSPEAFVTEVLAKRHGARGVVVGPDFRFGKGRAGSAESLAALGAAHGMEVEVLDVERSAGERVSSTLVRSALAAGDVTRATELLGHVHETEGVVERGQALGRELGFPTANLRVPATLLPKDGIYAVVAKRVDVAAELAAGDAAPLWLGAASLGERPTVAAGRALEVHLFDVAPDLYGSTLRVGWVARLRGEEKYDGLETLKRAIARDVEAARQILHAMNPEAVRWM